MQKYGFPCTSYGLFKVRMVYCGKMYNHHIFFLQIVASRDWSWLVRSTPVTVSLIGLRM